jgi:hypothetical protein
MVIRGSKGERVVDAEDYFIGPGIDITRMTVLQPGELLTAIRIPATWAGAHFYFEKIRDRQVWDFPIVNIASAAVFTGDRIDRIRIAMNGVAAHPVRLKERRSRDVGKPRNEATADMAGKMAITGRRAAAVQRLQSSADAESGEAGDSGSGGAGMGIVEWAKSPWGQDVPIHILWYLIWVSAIAGFAFLVVHAIWVRYFAKPEEFAGQHSAGRRRAPARASCPALSGRPSVSLDHGRRDVRAADHGFPARVGVKFPWVTYHWIAGHRADGSIIFHIIHASFFMDFWSIWPDKDDIEDAGNG